MPDIEEPVVPLVFGRLHFEGRQVKENYILCHEGGQNDQLDGTPAYLDLDIAHKTGEEYAKRTRRKVQVVSRTVWEINTRQRAVLESIIATISPW